MNRILFGGAFALGAVAVIWIAAGFIGSDALALTVTLMIGLVYGIGCFEMLQYRRATASLGAALQSVPAQLERLDPWLAQLPDGLRNPVRLRIEGERIALPGPVFTPYLVGLLVMLGLLGTFVGMVVTLQGAVLALESTTELQAMRAGLATPIKGLGLAFGTSVAGVAASAMLGLISTLSRRERLSATARLDQVIGEEFRGFSLNHSRQETYKALQSQAQALPQVAERLQSMADQMETMTRTMTSAIVSGQQQFQDTAARQFAELASSVEQSLKNSLAESGRLAGESIQPLVSGTMRELAQQAQHTQAALQSQTRQQLQELATQFSATVVGVSDAWQSGLAQYDQRQQQLVTSLDAAMQGFDQRFNDMAEAFLNGVNGHSEQVLQRLGEGDQQRLLQWQSQLEGTSSGLVAAWEQNAKTLLQEWMRVLDQSSAQVQARLQAEEQWGTQQSERLQQLTATLHAELGQLRAEEASRGQAAVQRLADLEAVVSGHLTQLGSALETPMLALIETASQAPKAAAEVLEQLRREISNNIERDNELLAERQRIMADLNGILGTVEKASTEQRAAIEALVTVSTEKLAAVSEHFGHQVGGETAKLQDMADHLEASAVEVSSLGEAFGHAVELFSASNDKLIENLNRVEAALDKSSSRSDEQLAYYVAQAREIIDLSMLSQKEIMDELRAGADTQAAARPEQGAQQETQQAEAGAAAEVEVEADVEGDANSKAATAAKAAKAKTGVAEGEPS
ncbi:DUF802 domain-containing protein [Ketobacter sp.]|uniref:DUF802 domain-containing protein n=1 Tax=Ketobacter sp. TaxID=2083498 RepID=UPI0025BC2DD1|nr:DUF802 domain-containing protein [Ketobacter sp.]